MGLGSAVMAAVLWATSGLPGLFLGRRSALGERIAAILGVLGSLMGLAAAGYAIASGIEFSFRWPGVLPDTSVYLRLDALSGFFLIPVYLLGAIGAMYGLGYWPQARYPRTAQKLRLWYGVLIASMGMLVLAGDGISFLIAWEVMALSGFFLVSTEDQKKQVREAGWLYLVATHAGTLVLFATFVLLRIACGSFELKALDPAHAGTGICTAIFLTALVGFGFKAGIMPLHFWLPAAHANAPSHVSAILSGVLLKMGIYGILRTLTLLPAPHIAWGGLVLGLGSISAVLGVLFALGQHDLKRLLAYHSIENIGIILMGLGLAMLGQARGRPAWIALGLAGCLLHVWNHSMFKSLLFFSAGSVIHKVHTRQIDQMGGLAKSMPATAALFLIGAIAICGLPPLNGFVSELFIYVGLLHTLDSSSAAALAAPILAMAGALALACFVKAYGAVFLGTARTNRSAPCDAPLVMRLAMGAAAFGCVIIGVLPALVASPLEHVVGQFARNGMAGQSIGSLVPLAALTRVAFLLAGLIALIWLALRQLSPSRRVSLTWDCGYAQPTRLMQYTASSFAQGLVGVFRGVLRPHTHRPELIGPFPAAASFASHVDDPVLDATLRPLWQRIRSELGRLRFLQQGSVHRYLFYILLTLFVLLLSSFSLFDAVRRIFMQAR